MNIHPEYKLLFVSDDKGYMDTEDSLSNESFARIAIHWWAKTCLSLPHPEFNRLINDVFFIGVFYKGEGEVIRSPDPRNWNDPGFINSRDQILMFLVFLKLTEWNQTAKLIIKRAIKNWFRYPNGDLASLEIGVLFGRGKWYTWIFDLFMFGTMLNRIGVLPRWKHETHRFVALKPDDVGDDKLLIALLWLAHTSPTWVSRLTTRLYFKHRPKPEKEGYPLPSHQNNVQKSMSLYFHANSGNNPEIADAWEPLISKMYREYG